MNPQKESEGAAEYTGAEIAKNGNTISMTQKLYAAIVVEPDIEISDERLKKIDEALDKTEINALRQYCGILGWPSII